MAVNIIVLVILLFLSGFFSSAETALFSISNVKARHIAKEKSLLNNLILKMKKRPHDLLTTILIGNNIVNIGSSAIATSISIKMFQNNAVGIATGLMTLLILVFGEIIPKSIATRNNIIIARIVILPVYWLSFLLFPFIKLLNFIPRLTGKIKKTPTVTEEELLTILEVVEEEGEIKKEEKKLISNIFEFDDINASEIMTPRGDMYAINIDEIPEITDILKSGFSRIPVYENDLDNIIGIINIKDLFNLHLNTSSDKNLKKIMRKPYFIPESKKIDTMLKQFKRMKHHIAIIVDEHGGIEGLLTLEDVIEEIVGEIVDETDKIESHIIQNSENEWVILGKTEIDEVNETIEINIPDSKDYDTFSGFILDKTGKIPKEKETIHIDNFNVIVKEVEGNRIKSFIIRKKMSEKK